eukprot:TRINITY_DN179863_c0_g1_i1.p2 TRINITY_DN179863_c0_g1~~TRINITY_DN179863_c0_g1_i1.p2  ORF type:complete len:150 (+),score=30.31 TRINITY_DN179863_c0_g1_i1:70-519(+)
MQGDTLIYEREHTGYEQAPTSLNAVTDDGVRTRLIAPPAERSLFDGMAFARQPDGSVVFAQMVRGEDGQGYSIVRERDADDADGSGVTTIAGVAEGPLYRDGPAGEATQYIKKITRNSKKKKKELKEQGYQIKSDTTKGKMKKKKKKWK